MTHQQGLFNQQQAQMNSQNELMTKQNEQVNKHNAQMSEVMTLIATKLAGPLVQTVTPSKNGVKTYSEMTSIL